MRKKPRAAIDIGGTLEETWKSKRRWFKSRGADLGPCPRDRDDIISFPGVSMEMYDSMRRHVYSPTQILSHNLVNGARNALSIVSLEYEIFLLSSRDEDCRDVTFEWLSARRIVEFVDQAVFLGNDADKFKWSIANDMSLMIDDDSRHLGICEKTGPGTRIHLSSAPRKADEASLFVQKASNWKRVLDLLEIDSI